MTWMQKIKSWRAFFFEARPRTFHDAIRIAVNKTFFFVWSMARHLWKSLPSPDYRIWIDYPFSLRGIVLWGEAPHAWYVLEDHSSLSSMGQQRWEPQQWVFQSLSSGMVFIDIGAHQGRYTLQASHSVGSGGSVVAIDASSVNIGLLAKNLRLNHVQNVTLVPVACWSEHAMLSLNDAVTTDMLGVTRNTQENHLLIPGLPLDKIVQHKNLQRVDWIKIDVEGAEVEVLAGAAETISRYTPQIFIEVHDTLPAVMKWLAKHDYTLVRSYRGATMPPGYGWILAAPRQINALQNRI